VAELSRRRVGAEEDLPGADGLRHGAVGAAKGVGAGPGFVLETHEAAGMSDAQDFVNAVPSQFSPNPAGMEGVMDIDISFDEKGQSFHMMLSSGWWSRLLWPQSPRMRGS